jgi:hypothetical protein
MWVIAHSGRLPAFYSFIKGFGGIKKAWEPIAGAIFMDVHKRITPPQDLNRVFVFKGSVEVDDKLFAVAVDEGVYPQNARYPIVDGRVDFSPSEMALPSQIRKEWLSAIGGEQGIADGNGIYFAGNLTAGVIMAEKIREMRREGLIIERIGDNLRMWLLAHGK